MNGITQSKHIGFIIICLLVSLIFAYYFSSKHAYVTLDIDTNRATYFQIYWAGENQGFSEQRSSSAMVFPKKNNYIFPIDDLGKIDRLRIDPSNKDNTHIKFNSLLIFQDGYKLDAWIRTDKFNKIEQHKGFSQFGSINNLFQVKTAETDANFVLPLDPDMKHTTWWLNIFRLLLIFFLLALSYKYIDFNKLNTNYIPALLLIVAVLSGVMALLSPMNAHPDEFAHVRAAVFYKYHFLLPQVCDLDSRFTYSIYGASRLNTNEIYYYIAGRVLQFFAFIPLTEYYILRIFNIVLLAILAIIGFQNQRSHLILLPLLLTPQTWYVFSYANSEGFALFVCAITGIQFFDRNSFVWRVLSNIGSRKKTVLSSITVIALVALLLLLKKNFYFYLLFILVLGLLALFFYRRDGCVKKQAKQAATLAFAGLLLASVFVVWHEFKNDFERSEAKLECRNIMAHKEFKTTTPIDQSAYSLYWRDKGLPFMAIFDRKWHTRAQYSFFGHYGYLDVQTTPAYYNLITGIFLLFILYILFSGLFFGSAFQKSTTLTFLLLSLALIGTVMWKSWTVDFQPQGRYLFPMLPMLGVTLYLLWEKLQPIIITFFTMTLFALGVYSFVFIALAELV